MTSREEHQSEEESLGRFVRNTSRAPIIQAIVYRMLQNHTPERHWAVKKSIAEIRSLIKDALIVIDQIFFDQGSNLDFNLPAIRQVRTSSGTRLEEYLRNFVQSSEVSGVIERVIQIYINSDEVSKDAILDQLVADLTSVLQVATKTVLLQSRE